LRAFLLDFKVFERLCHALIHLVNLRDGGPREKGRRVEGNWPGPLAVAPMSEGKRLYPAGPMVDRRGGVQPKEVARNGRILHGPSSQRKQERPCGSWIRPRTQRLDGTQRSGLRLTAFRPAALLRPARATPGKKPPVMARAFRLRRDPAAPTRSGFARPFRFGFAGFRQKVGIFAVRSDEQQKKPTFRRKSDFVEAGPTEG
jgi:hypothetical protein